MSCGSEASLAVAKAIMAELSDSEPESSQVDGKEAVGGTVLSQSILQSGGSEIIGGKNKVTS